MANVKPPVAPKVHTTLSGPPRNKHHAKPVQTAKFHCMAHFTLRKPSRDRKAMPMDPGPKAATVNAILSFSKALKVVNVPPVGQVGLVLN